MFPLNSNNPYIKDTGERTTLGAVIGSGGGGGDEPYTPDYENDRLIIGRHGLYDYYVPMSKEFIYDTDDGYEIITNPASSSTDAMIDLYKVAYIDGTVHKRFVKTIHHEARHGDNTYTDDNISISYTSNWTVQATATLYKENGESYANPLVWAYNTNVDYVMLLEDPV